MPQILSPPVVSTRVLSPRQAVISAAFFNFAAFLLFPTTVAETIGKGIVDIRTITSTVVLAGLVGAILWNMITWYFGLPSSSSHALIGGYAGAAIVKSGIGSDYPKWFLQDVDFYRLGPYDWFVFGFFIKDHYHRGSVYRQKPAGREPMVSRFAAFFCRSL